MKSFEDFCKSNKLNTAYNDSYKAYGFYCQGYAEALDKAKEEQ